MHLIHALHQTTYEIQEDWKGNICCCATLRWNYVEQYVDISMPGYISKQLVTYAHEMPNKPQHYPFMPASKKYGKDAQQSAPKDNNQRFSDVGSLLYYARAVNITMHMELSTIACEQAKSTEQTEQRTNQLLNCFATNPLVTVWYCASAMILTAHSDA